MKVFTPNLFIKKLLVQEIQRSVKESTSEKGKYSDDPFYPLWALQEPMDDDHEPF